MNKPSRNDNNNNRSRSNNGNRQPRSQDQGEKRPKVDYTQKRAASIVGQIFHAIRAEQKSYPNRWGRENRTSLNDMKKIASWLLLQGQYNDAVERALDIVDAFRIRINVAEILAQDASANLEKA